jgi:hypothetical protein
MTDEIYIISLGTLPNIALSHLFRIIPLNPLSRLGEAERFGLHGHMIRSGAPGATSTDLLPSWQHDVWYCGYYGTVGVTIP